MVTFTLNGSSRTFDGDPDMPLLWYLRDDVGLTGTKFGCGGGFCGACTVHLDGQAARACQMPMSAMAGKTVVTIEGLGGGQTHPVQQAWIAANVAQCGYCQAGQIMQAAALLASTPHPTDAQIDAAMAGNICRCGTYQRIRVAITRAAGARA
jgi:isoquinoline 1-oxidoreductase alpha subunit